jgi:hypothetical protein
MRSLHDVFVEVREVAKEYGITRGLCQVILNTYGCHKITTAERNAALHHIQDLITPNVLVESWLIDHGIPLHLAARQSLMQEYRYRWLDHIIEELRDAPPTLQSLRSD